MKILVVEDEEALAEALLLALDDEGYVVDLAVDGTRADELMTETSYDLVILDWSIPPPTGFELLTAWRQRRLQVPVLMLTGRRDLEDRVDGLDAGADDYLTKPFHYVELLARARSLLRRRDRELAPLKVGDLEMDRGAHRVTVRGEPVTLTPKEFGVLEYLLTHAGRVVTRDALGEHAWETGAAPTRDVVDVILSRLRKKIDGGREGSLLETLKGVGYRLREERG